MHVFDSYNTILLHFKHVAFESIGQIDWGVENDSLHSTYSEKASYLDKIYMTVSHQ